MVIILSCNRRRRKKNDKIIAYCNGVQSVVFKAVNCLISTRGNNKYVKLKTNGNIKLIVFFPQPGSFWIQNNINSPYKMQSLLNNPLMKCA